MTTFTGVGAVSVGDEYIHYKNGAIYTVTAMYKGSTDGYHDDEWWVAYASTLGEYVTPYDRFVGMVEVPRFKKRELFSISI